MTSAASAPRALIVGLGKSGLSAARHLSARGWDLAVTDSRESPPGQSAVRALQPGARAAYGRFDLSLLDGVALVVASPGVALDEPLMIAARERGIEVVGDVELFAREAPAPVVGITGTNGKSTVTTLVGRMALRSGRRVAVGGNLGTPVLDLLAQSTPELYVIELSSFQLEYLVAAVARRGCSQSHGGSSRSSRQHAGLLRREGAHLPSLCNRRRQLRRSLDALHARSRRRRRFVGTGAERVVGFSVAGASGADYSLVERQGSVGSPFVARRYLRYRQCGSPVCTTPPMRSPH